MCFSSGNLIWLRQSVLELFSHEPLGSKSMICLWSQECVWRSRHSQSVEWSYLACWWCPCLNMVLPPSVWEFWGMYHLMMETWITVTKTLRQLLNATSVLFVSHFACTEIITVSLYTYIYIYICMHSLPDGRSLHQALSMLSIRSFI